MFTAAFRVSIVALSIAVGLAGAPAAACAQRRSDRSQIDTTLQFDKTGTVTIGNSSSTIVVTGWDQGTIRIRAHGDQGLMRFSASTRAVTIDPTRSSDEVDIQVWVPRGVRVVARTNSGDITIRGTRGDIDAQTSSGEIVITDAKGVAATSLSGDVDIRQTTGAVTATTNNGDLTVADAHGNIEATSVSGDVSISRATSKVVSATVTSGDISYSGTIEPDGRYELTTHSGDIELALPKDASARVAVTTWSGSIDSDFPITLKPGSTAAGNGVTKHFTFTIGSGSAHITAESFSGDIVITSRGGR